MHDEDDFQLDDPFDDADEWFHEQVEGGEEESPAIDVQALLRDLGIEGYDGVIVDFSTIDPSELRGQRFDTLDEAIIFLYDIGILSFSEVVELDDDTFGFIVKYGTE